MTEVLVGVGFLFGFIVGQLLYIWYITKKAGK